MFLETATTAAFVAGFSVNLPATRPAGMSTPPELLDRLPGAVSGASLVQVLTSLLYRGPSVARTIHSGLAALLERDGFRTVVEAVGVDA